MVLETSVTSTGTTIEKSSGNIFADLGLPHPAEPLLKSQLALHLPPRRQPRYNSRRNTRTGAHQRDCSLKARV